MTSVVDLRQSSRPDSTGLGGLNIYLSQLIGEPFLFLKVSYGNELTLHFGTPREAKSSKLKDRTRGSYILSARGSAWRLKSEVASQLVVGGLSDPGIASWLEKPISKENLEEGKYITSGARVVAANAFVAPSGGFALLLVLSDDTSFILLPTDPELAFEGLPDDMPDKIDYVADWELLTPHGYYLRVGPWLKWEYIPSRSGKSPEKGSQSDGSPSPAVGE